MRPSEARRRSLESSGVTGWWAYSESLYEKFQPLQKLKRREEKSARRRSHQSVYLLLLACFLGADLRQTRLFEPLKRIDRFGLKEA
jgi:hypothetical protein